MSAEQKLQVASFFNWTYKGVIAATCGLVCYTFLTMKEDVQIEFSRVNASMVDIRGDMKLQTNEFRQAKEAIIGIEGRVTSNTKDIERHERAFDRLKK